MSLVFAFTLGIAVGVSLEALALALLAGWRDRPADSRLHPWTDDRTRRADRWKLKT